MYNIHEFEAIWNPYMRGLMFHSIFNFVSPRCVMKFYNSFALFDFYDWHVTDCNMMMMTVNFSFIWIMNVYPFYSAIWGKVLWINMHFFFRYLKAFLEQEMFLLYRNRNDFIEGPSMILLKDLLTMCLSTLGLQAPQEYRSFPSYYRSFNSCYCDSLYSILWFFKIY